MKEIEKLTLDGDEVDLKEYVKSANAFVELEAERVAKNVISHQNENTFSFFVFTDAHYFANNANIVKSILHAGQGMNLVRHGVKIDFAVNLGDNGWGSSIKDDPNRATIDMGRAEIWATNKAIDDAFQGIPNFRMPGNHCYLTRNYDFNSYDYLDGGKLYPFYGAYNTGAVYPIDEKKRGYCYRDFEAWKLRVIVLNTVDIDAPDTDLYISGTQLKWFAETIDLSTKADSSKWNILLLSHHPLDFGISIFSCKILKAYTEGGAVSLTRDGIEINYDYAGKNVATIIANIHGHNHNLKVDNLRYLVNGSTTEPIGIKRICIPNACFLRSNERGTPADTADVFDIDYGEDITYNKTAGTAKDTAFCVITVDTKQRKVYANCYGAGYDRIIDYGEESQLGYTNLLPHATTELNGTEIYNKTGYQEGVRYGSSGTISEQSGMCLSGWISVAEGDVIRVKNISVEGSTSSYFVRMNKYDTVQVLNINTIGDADENGIYTFIVDGYYKGFRLSVGKIDEKTIITKNEEITD